MAKRQTRTQSNEQKSEAQRSESMTSAEGTSLKTESEAQTKPSVEELAAETQRQHEEMNLSPSAKEPEGETGDYKTTGNFYWQDPTTGDTVFRKASTVRLSMAVRTAEEEGRIEKA